LVKLLFARVGASQRRLEHRGELLGEIGGRRTVHDLVAEDAPLEVASNRHGRTRGRICRAKLAPVESLKEG